MTHIIEEIDLHSALEQQYTLCSCGDTVRVGVFLTLGNAWDDHRGAPVYISIEHAERATDADVAAFFRKLDDPNYVAPLPEYPSAFVTERDKDSVVFLIDTLLDEHWPREIYDCAVCRSLSKYDARKAGRQVWW
jgi:hypothetical protein